jgi:hypothetical protein
MGQTDPVVRPDGQAKASKRKQMKAKFLSFIFIYFFESGLFKGLRPIQAKKSGALSCSVQSVSIAFLSFSEWPDASVPPMGIEIL